MICFDIYGVNIMSVEYKFDILEYEKNVCYSFEIGWFLWKFSMILAEFFSTRLTKMKRIQTDPQHW